MHLIMCEVPLSTEKPSPDLGTLLEAIGEESTTPNPLYQERQGTQPEHSLELLLRCSVKRKNDEAGKGDLL